MEQFFESESLIMRYGAHPLDTPQGRVWIPFCQVEESDGDILFVMQDKHIFYIDRSEAVAAARLWARKTLLTLKRSL